MKNIKLLPMTYEKSKITKDFFRNFFACQVKEQFKFYDILKYSGLCQLSEPKPVNPSCTESTNILKPHKMLAD